MPNYQQTPNRDAQNAGSTPNQQSGQRTESTQTPGSTQASKGASTSSASGQGSSTSAGKSEQSLSDRANKMVDDYKSTAIERIGDVRERAESGLLAQRQGVTERIQRMGDMLRSASDQVRREDEFVARYLDVASVRAEKLASYIENADFASMAEDVGRFARERPAWVIGGSFLAGLAIGRFLKSAAPRPEFGERSELSYERGRRYDMAGRRPETYTSESNVGTGYTQGSGYQSSGYQSSGYQGSQSSSYQGSQKPSSTGGAGYGQSTASTYPQSYTATPGTDTSKSYTGGSTSSPSTTSTTSTQGASTSSTTPSTSTPSTSTPSTTSGSSVGTTQKVGFPQGRKGES